MAFGVQKLVHQPHGVVLGRVRAALDAEGFVVLTPHDVADAFDQAFGLEIPPQVTLGVCTPGLAHATLQADPSVGLLVPCSVVVRAADPGRTVVEASRLHLIVALTGDRALEPAVADADARLRAACDRLADLSCP
ncbi:Uncharacterized conserved protein, DUF302 family [Friedmanniella luteola]|uniref:Uncharacterized conserved protein, DUF302 family n=1 Tax=Friedmanniella luteola TaxID=546871 RepID=A0A1H1T909_9ACTN|nr:DUF302 domain-containing protein [Friedmanniella luteola]SDS56089.1 Uncharacterized conserved protein, DUF302 family [Friedmanniella luteola]